MSTRLIPITVGLLLAIAGAAQAQPKPEGFLCCNMYAEGDWISDSNYRDQGKKLIPLGTPARVTDYGRYRVFVEMANQKMRLGNDYSRNLPLGDFAGRYIVATDPAAKLASWPANVQTAVKSGKVMVGMTKEQVLMALGYPIQSENPSLDAPIWRYWLSSFAEFQVQWDASGRVQDIAGDVMTKNLVVQPGR
jgi:hypothetical protein